MNTEIRNCQNCKQDFTIENEDFLFYEKMKVPAPTFCPQCRLQRRLVWMKGLQLFKRKCDLCGEMKFSMYHPDAPYVVYCEPCWWSDNWNPSDYAIDYDSSKTFFEQWNELLHKVPLLGLSIDKDTGDTSPYTNHVGNSKNCYLIYYSINSQDCLYGYYLRDSKEIIDSSPVMNCENCYDCGNIFRSFNMIGSYNVRQDIDSVFLRDCDSCTDCFGSAGLRSKSHVFFNEELTRDEYKGKLASINLGSYAEYYHWKKKAWEHWKTIPPRPIYDDLSTNCTGSYCFQSRDCRECYEVVGAENSKYLMLIKNGPVNEAYDYTDWGYRAEMIYECMTVGEEVQNVKFTEDSGHGLFNVEYSKLSIGGSHHFGCVSINKGEYCILNKTYSKEEYETLREKIVDDMKKNPYISKQGHVYTYGEFFPPEFSPLAYNDSFASRFFPLQKEDVIQKGLSWYEPEVHEYAITIKSEDLPDDIKDAPSDVTKEIIGCSKCARGFRIIPYELQFLKTVGLPLPRKCPFCRIWEKIDRWVENMRLHDRICNKCGCSFKTHYSKERAPFIYCKECYKQEML